eukprot:9340337-Lingulodinium_polyedra.AAC.1
MCGHLVDFGRAPFTLFVGLPGALEPDAPAPLDAKPRANFFELARATRSLTETQLDADGFLRPADSHPSRLPE